MRYWIGLMVALALVTSPLSGRGDEKAECSTNADCDDERSCTYDRCDSKGRCYFPDMPNGTYCTALCLFGGSPECQGGSCVCADAPCPWWWSTCP